MSTINDLADLVSQFSCDISEERFVNEMKRMKTMIAQIQSDQTELVEKRIELIKKNEDLKKEINGLKQKIVNP